ncbi:MAG: hypothetical protein IJO85_05130 [Lachnospiraceae bacterium]|nr:hypothetical protein [Lachnospiraceae bacterium]
MKRVKKIVIAVALCLAVILSMLPVARVKADMGGWITDASGVMTITGTNITVREFYGNLYIEGTGAIPDYTPATYTMRPWHYLDIHTVNIGAGITEIGSFAFADKTSIKKVNISATTFIKDNTSFANVNSNVIFRVGGTIPQTKYFNSIEYTSLDSIAANAPNASQCMFIMDSYDAAQKFREKAYPYLKYVYSATDESGPWNSKKDTTKDIRFDTVCKISPDSGLHPLTTMTAQRRLQGSAFIEYISYFLEDYTYLCSYNMALSDQNGIIYGTNGAKRYVLQLQPKDQIMARQYRLIERGPDGQLFYLDDLDNNYATVTFETFYPTSTYALVYKYDLAMLQAMTMPNVAIPTLPTP